VRGVLRNIAMLILCLLAAGGFAGILTWCLRRLNRIEEEMWGEKARRVGGRRKGGKGDAQPDA